LSVPLHEIPQESGGDGKKIDSQMMQQTDAEYFLFLLPREGRKEEVGTDCGTGAWLITVPNRLNGTILSVEEKSFETT